MDIKKLITGFLILSAITSSSVLLFSNFSGNSGIAINTKQNDSPSANRTPDNVFIESIPANNSSAEAVNPQDDGLPPLSTSSNLTDRLAASIIRDVVKTNPNGPQGQEGQLSLIPPDLDATLEKTLFSENMRKSVTPWNVSVSNSDIKIIKNYTLSDLENYSKSLNHILSTTVADEKIISILQGGESSAEAINAVSLAVEQTNIALRKLPVPESLLNFHKSLLTLVLYQKNALGTLISEDPLQGAIGMQYEEKNYQLAISRFQDEFEKLESIIKTSSLESDSSSIFVDLLAIKTTHAFFFSITFDPANLARMVWEYVSNIILQTIKNQLVHRIMAQTINWIQGGGKPQFITNWKGFLGQVEKDTAGLAIQEKIPGLCRSLGPLIQLQLNRIYLAEPIVACTLDQVVQDVKNFYNDFSYGGWVGYGALILPSGNYYGSLFETTQEIEMERLAAANAARSNAQASGGFLPTKVCVNYRQASDFDECISGCVDFVGPREEGASPCVQSCEGLSTVPKNRECKETRDTTPGKVAGDAVATAMSAPLHNIVNASDVAGIVSALIDSTITRLFQAGVKGLLGLTMKDKISGRESAPDGVVTTPHQQDLYDQEKNAAPKELDDTDEGEGVPPPVDADGKHGNHASEVDAAKNQLLSQGKTFIQGSPDYECDRFEITRNAARLIGGGAGLLSKPGGTNCQGYSVDIIAFPDGYIYDVLNGTAPDGAGPMWGPTGCGTIQTGGTCADRYRPAN